MAALLGAVVAADLALLVIYGLRGGGASGPPTPPRPVAAASVGTALPSASRTELAKAPPFHCSSPAPAASPSTRPLQICIPGIHVDATVMRLGLNRDRTVEVPPLSRVGDAGWYKYSAAPGAVGPTVILGHVDSAQYGDGVFFDLGRLRAGDPVRVVRADGAIAQFRIDRVSEVSKTRFPTQAVYGATSGPALRLVTCGGKFDSSTGSYEDNIIAYGTLESLQRG